MICMQGLKQEKGGKVYTIAKVRKNRSLRYVRCTKN